MYAYDHSLIINSLIDIKMTRKDQEKKQPLVTNVFVV